MKTFFAAAALAAVSSAAAVSLPLTKGVNGYGAELYHYTKADGATDKTISKISGAVVIDITRPFTALSDTDKSGAVPQDPVATATLTDEPKMQGEWLANEVCLKSDGTCAAMTLFYRTALTTPTGWNYLGMAAPAEADKNKNFPSAFGTAQDGLTSKFAFGYSGTGDAAALNVYIGDSPTANTNGILKTEKVPTDAAGAWTTTTIESFSYGKTELLTEG